MCEFHLNGDEDINSKGGFDPARPTLPTKKGRHADGRTERGRREYSLRWGKISNPSPTRLITPPPSFLQGEMRQEGNKRLPRSFLHSFARRVEQKHTSALFSRDKGQSSFLLTMESWLIICCSGHVTRFWAAARVCMLRTFCCRMIQASM